ncbi:serine hydrolase domain-containing protein [Methylovirgula sp. 4M-Z18]|uniref:serine hydrolase domain-containing protein n=1 Tax=Methylovirgula sp. 4M-Z18 TaxID=2293567 RepID=UPI000E2E97BC|nr:serine hydrolase [Methylovirgula sp. 4M-Z18]RFB78138.1 class C beta-lactamase-related serine hydrolase [Methylovirgula sp. 4M-Z18]
MRAKLIRTAAALVLGVIALSTMTGGMAAAQPTCGVPGNQKDGWEIATPASVGIDAAILCDLAHRIGDWKEANIHAILIARHGKLVFEQYYAGPDEKWGEPIPKAVFGPTMPHDLRSITRSVLALLLGIAIDKGWVHDVDLPVFTLLPNYTDLRTPEKDKIVLRDLLTMSSGLAWNERAPYGNPANSDTRMDQADDPCHYALEQPIDHQPGKVWAHSGGSAAVIACILHQATGKTIDTLAEEVLFKPLNISNVEWARYPKTGEPIAASGLRLLPRDTLKIGQLVLAKGVWRGSQIISANWIDDATAPHINGPGPYFFGYQFWLGRSLVNLHEVDWAAGFGSGGQRLFIVPALDLVVLVHAGMYSGPMDDGTPGTVVLNRFVLPATTP